MEFLRHLVLFIHILGFAALLGGMVVQLREPQKQVNPAMRDGIGTAFVAGLLAVGLLEADDADVNHMKIGVKLLVALVLLVLVMMNLRKERISDGLFWTLLLLTVGNIAVAVFWV